MKLFLFEDIESSYLEELYSKAKSIGAFISSKEVSVKEYDSMVSLTDRTAGGFMSPLKSS